MSYADISDGLKKILRQDVLVIVIIILSFLTVQYLWVLGVSETFGTINTPSVSIFTRTNDQAVDSDGDGLPDLVEGTEENPCTRGEKVEFPKGYNPSIGERDFMGYCTETDPNDPDTDGDGFSDSIEDNLGSNPTFWWDPGYIYIVWALTAIAIVAYRYTNKPSLKKYEKLDEQKSGGVAGKGKGKFAYGSTSPFGKQASEMTEEERREAIESDERFQKLTSEKQETDQKSKEDNDGLIASIKQKPLRFALAIITGIILVFLI